MYIWQRDDWPAFRWNNAALKARLEAVRLLGRTETVSSQVGLDMGMDALIQNAIRTSEIEGEYLDVGSVRSSVARQLGLDRGPGWWIGPLPAPMRWWPCC